MNLIEVLVTALGIIAGLGNIPQVTKIFRRKSARDISILTFLFFFINAIVLLIYGFQLNSLPIVISNSIYIITNALIITGWIFYGRGKK